MAYDQTLFIPLGVLVISLVICLAGIVFMFRSKVIVDQAGEVVNIDIPIFGKLKTNVPAIGALFIAAALAAFTLKYWKTPPNQSLVTASVTLNRIGAVATPDIVVGIIPGEYIRYSSVPQAANSFSVDIPVSDEGNYTGVAYFRSAGSVEAYLTQVVSSSGKKKFEAELTVK